MDETLTGSTEEDAVKGDAAAVVVAFHPDPAHLGRTLRLAAGSVLFGRDEQQVGLDLHRDRRLSRTHAELIRIRGELVIRDLDSRNGTYVNGSRITHRSLQDGDLIRMGSMALVARWIPKELPEIGTERLGMLGAGPAHRRLIRTIEEYAARSTVVLLEGEAGVGKGRIAQALHAASGRSGPLVTFDCGAVAPGVMHSELFGHAAGAFSGASSRRAGLIERARGGTLFLDEIGDASPELQSSLLRLLEEGEYRPVGSDRIQEAQVRIVAATNRNLDRAVEADRFRFDLLTRLRRLGLVVPPLRERIEDVPLLGTRFLQNHLGPKARMHRGLAFALLEHRWPGNVRELDAVMERAAVVTNGIEEVRYQPGLLPDHVVVPDSKPPATVQKSRTGKPDAAELAKLLDACGGNVTHLAEQLGVARHTLYRWIQSYGIDLEAYR